MVWKNETWDTQADDLGSGVQPVSKRARGQCVHYLRPTFLKYE